MVVYRPVETIYSRIIFHDRNINNRLILRDNMATIIPRYGGFLEFVSVGAASVCRTHCHRNDAAGYFSV